MEQNRAAFEHPVFFRPSSGALRQTCSRAGTGLNLSWARRMKDKEAG